MDTEIKLDTPQIIIEPLDLSQVNFASVQSQYKPTLKVNSEEFDKLTATLLNEKGLDDFNIGARAGFLAGVCMKAEAWEKAIPFWTMYLERALHATIGWSNLAACFLCLKRWNEARNCLDFALAIDPNDYSAKMNSAYLAEQTGRGAEALPLYDEILDQNPDDHKGKTHKAIALLLRGRFEEGFPLYRSRLQKLPETNLLGRIPAPWWEGELLWDSHIAIWTDQGIGDEVLCASMFNDVIRQAGKVTILCSQRLVGVFRSSFPKADVMDHWDYKKIKPDFQATFSELGAVLRSKKENFPESTGYLVPEPTFVKAYRSRYEMLAEGRKIVGISWHSFSKNVGEDKSLHDFEVRKLVEMFPKYFFVSLQYPYTNPMPKYAGIYTDESVRQFQFLLPYVAQIAAMDEVFTISNTTAHIAGALGKKTRLMVPSGVARLWYWGETGEESLWYPNTEVYRKNPAFGWSGTLARIHNVIHPPVQLNLFDDSPPVEITERLNA